MNILQINNVDLLGRRYNGYDLNIALSRDGITAHQMVVDKLSKNKNVIDLTKKIRNVQTLRSLINKIELELSMRGMLFPFGYAIKNHKAFINADIVHYHIIYNEVLSLAHFTELTQKKINFLTIHDCTLFTGHCVHPVDCTRFETGCVNCPDIKRLFPMKEDKAALMWAIKKRVFSEASLELIISSTWMLDKIKKSPILSHFKTHHIPFGIDVEFYAKNRENPRKKLGIPQDAFVLFFRAQDDHKGLEHIINALNLMDKKPFLITCENTGYFKNYSGSYKEFGIITDDHIMAQLYASCDVFLMPSTGESFGLMAIECMASGKPIIIADGTALPGVTFAPDCGFSIPQGDADALKYAIEKLRDHPEERKKRGVLGQKIAREQYKFEDYYRRHKELYYEAIKKNSKYSEIKKIEIK